MNTKLAAFLIPAVFALLAPLLAVAQQAGPQSPWDWPGPWHMWGGGWGMWWIFPLFMLFMIIACVAFFLFGHRSGGYHGGPMWHMVDRPWGPGRSWGDPTYSALQVLNERFARGEIEKQEYEEKKAAIVSSGQH